MALQSQQPLWHFTSPRHYISVCCFPLFLPSLWRALHCAVLVLFPHSWRYESLHQQLRNHMATMFFPINWHFLHWTSYFAKKPFECSLALTRSREPTYLAGIPCFPNLSEIKKMIAGCRISSNSGLPTPVRFISPRSSRTSHKLSAAFWTLPAFFTKSLPLWTKAAQAAAEFSNRSSTSSM